MWSKEESERRIRSAPGYRHSAVDDKTVDEIVVEYVRITGDRVRKPAKRGFIAACAHLHGSRFLELVQAVFERTGTATNLLGIIREMAPEDVDVYLTEGAHPIAAEQSPPYAVSTPNIPFTAGAASERYALPALPQPLDNRPSFSSGTQRRKSGNRPAPEPPNDWSILERAVEK
jgi:hypothetical protein